MEKGPPKKILPKLLLTHIRDPKRGFIWALT